MIEQTLHKEDSPFFVNCFDDPFPSCFLLVGEYAWDSGQSRGLYADWPVEIKSKRFKYVQKIGARIRSRTSLL
jgi:hypothetical protein